MILVVIGFSDILINSGFSQGIIQKKSIDNIELSSVFYLNILIGLGCVVFICLVAPLLATFYNRPVLTDLTRVLALAYFFKSFAVVQHGLMNRDMDFKKRTLTMLCAQVFSGIIAIIAAYSGMGVWSLVLNIILNDFLITIIFWLQTSWKPLWVFQLRALSSLWRFSSKLLFMNILSQIGNKVDIFLVGKLFSPQTLGLYSKGSDFAKLPAGIGTQVITVSLFPVFSKIQDDLKLFINSYRHFHKLILMAFTPLFGVMFMCSDHIVVLLLGNEWVDSIPYFKWSTVIGLFSVTNGFMIYVLNAKGRSDLNLKKTMVQVPLRIIAFISLPVIFNNFNPLYFIFVYILFFISENIISIYFISNTTKTSFRKNLTLGLEYIILMVMIILLMESATTYYNIDGFRWLSILIFTIVIFLLYGLVLFFTKNETFIWGSKKLMHFIYKK